MKRPFDLPESLPLFVVPGAVLMPRARVTLQVFEPRYLQMIEDVLKTRERLIGLIQPAGSDSEGPLAAMGCAGRIIAFAEEEDEPMLITLGAVSRFRLRQRVDGFTPYPTGTVDWAGLEAADQRRESAPDPDLNRARLMQQLRDFMAHEGLTTDWEMGEQAEPEELINALSMALPFAPEEKQALLEAPDLAARRQLLEGLMAFRLHGGENEETLQ